MNIKDMSIVEVKALLYDLSMEQERISHNMRMLKEEIQRRLQEPEEAEEPEGDEPKKGD